MTIMKAGRPTSKQAAIEMVRDEENQVVAKLSINIPKTLHKQLKLKALNEDTTITEIILKAIGEHLIK